MKCAAWSPSYLQHQGDTKVDKPTAVSPSMSHGKSHLKGLRLLLVEVLCSFPLCALQAALLAGCDDLLYVASFCRAISGAQVEQVALELLHTWSNSPEHAPTGGNQRVQCCAMHWKRAVRQVNTDKKGASEAHLQRAQRLAEALMGQQLWAGDAEDLFHGRQHRHQHLRVWLLSQETS